MAVIYLFVLGLLARLDVVAQSTAGTATSKPAANITTIDSLPSITPFQIPPYVLSSLGLPLVIPSAEPRAYQPAPPGFGGLSGGSGKSGKGSGGRAAPGFAGNSGARQAPPSIGEFGIQGGLPFDRCEWLCHVSQLSKTLNVRSAQPRIVANITSITGAGHYTIYQCYNSHLSWRTASGEWMTSSREGKAKTTTTVIPTKVIVTDYTNTAVPTITRCDEVVVIPSKNVTAISLTFNEPWTSTITSFPSPVPVCKIREHQCEQAYQAYSSKTYSYISSVYSAHFAQRKPGLPGSLSFNDNIKPPCDAPLPACPPSEEVASCKLEARQATVYYWPTSVAGEFCGAKVSSEPEATIQGKANTAVYGQLTITSPSPLVVVPSVTRSVMPPATMVAEESDIFYRACGYPKDVSFQVNPFNISSVRTVMTPTKTVRHNYTFSTQYTSTTKGYLFNFADLNEASVPWDAFIGAGNCRLRDQNLCDRAGKTILPSQYNPELSLGEAAIQTADAAFAGCTIPNLSRNVKYVPITAATVTAPSITRWGASVSVGPKTLRLDPSAVARIQDEQASYPENDFVQPLPGDEDQEEVEDYSEDYRGENGGLAAHAGGKGRAPPRQGSRPEPLRITMMGATATAVPIVDAPVDQPEDQPEDVPASG